MEQRRRKHSRTYAAYSMLIPVHAPAAHGQALRTSIILFSLYDPQHLKVTKVGGGVKDNLNTPRLLSLHQIKITCTVYSVQRPDGQVHYAP